VILKNPIKKCDYINASWMTNSAPSNRVPKFIAAQGPMPHTIPHFLQMIIENKIRAIIMLTKLTEKGEGEIKS